MTQFPPDPESTTSFVRKLLLVLESRGESVEDQLYSVLEARSQPPFFKSYFDEKTGQRLASLSESKQLISEGTTGLRTWAAGKFLYAWLRDRPELTAGKSVLELGCGAGFTGIALLNNRDLSFSRLVMTDHHPKVISTLQSNLEANFPNSSQK